MKKKSIFTTVFAVLVVVGYTSPTEADAREQERVRETLIEWQLDLLRGHEDSLRTFLKEMPKGADLHSHLSGAVTTERLIEWGAEDGLCINRAFVAKRPPCVPGQLPLANTLSDPILYKKVLGAWSMEGFQGTLLEAHQHFFKTFGKFGVVLNDARKDDAIADVLSIAGRNHQIYVELMEGLNSSRVGEVASKYIQPEDPWNEPYLLQKRAQIMADPVFDATLEETKSTIEDSLDGAHELLGCGTRNPDPGCNVGVRIILSANRTQNRGYVFAQWVYGYELAQSSPHVVGVELVSSEENPNSLLYYDDEMFALDVLRRFNQHVRSRRTVHIALHAGELIPEVLPATREGQRQLTFHIRHAVEISHAERIGHGVDLFYEDDPLDLLREMSAADVMAEICLTSNATLLGKEGESHPVSAYLEHDVPAALATDDEGVLRIDITDEFVRAVIQQKLGYLTLKKMVRTSLEHSFLPGTSLWKVAGRYEVTDACADDALGNRHPSDECAQLLANSERAAMQWELEAEFNAFEERKKGEFLAVAAR